MKEFPKYPKIRVLGDEENKELLANDDDWIYIEEKMDGANTRFLIVDGKVIVGSRNVQITNDEGELQNERWRRAYNFVMEKLKKVDLKRYDRLMLVGETMVRHSIDYDWSRIPPILMFDVYDLNEGRFLDYNEKCRIFDEMNLPIVPLVKIVKAKDLRSMKIDDDFVPQSKWRDGKAEGVVFKNYKRQIFAKYVLTEFREVNKMAFGGSKKYASNDTEKVLFQYCTNQRIEKKIFELIDEGEELNMKLMQFLPKRVWDDIVEEEGKNILNSNYIIDLKKLRKMIAKRCLEVLKQMIVNNVLLNGGESE